MFQWLSLRCLVVVLFPVFAMSAYARNHVVTIIGGDTHFRGSLAEGACVVSTESRDMHVDMGRYRNNEFTGVGSESQLRIPFVVHLSDCNPELADRIGITFYGMTDPKEPDTFLVRSGDGGAVGVSGSAGLSGLGLVISDAQGNNIVPDTPPHLTTHLEGREVIIPFTARYRATSREVYPGALRSDVDFRLVYP
ncbi:fimbrial protein [Enterobacter hormaechei]